MNTKIKIEGSDILTAYEAMKILRCNSHRSMIKKLNTLGVNYKVVNRIYMIPKVSLEDALNK